MFASTFPVLTVALFSFSALAQDKSTTDAQKIGYTGTLSSLDGGLGGVVRVFDANTLKISSYTLEDASAPALYWWGTTSSSLKDGFRISNAQVTEAATSNTLSINLNAGKTSADFTTVGLWCESFSVNFGQAELKPSDGSGSSASTTEGGSP
ncbi:hypothetical protein IFR05_015571, partial [Cadophora sp. M221]